MEQFVCLLLELHFTLIKRSKINFKFETGIWSILEGCIHIPVWQHAKVHFLSTILRLIADCKVTEKETCECYLWTVLCTLPVADLYFKLKINLKPVKTMDQFFALYHQISFQQITL